MDGRGNGIEDRYSVQDVALLLLSLQRQASLSEDE
jgi:hypothetical protein